MSEQNKVERNKKKKKEWIKTTIFKNISIITVTSNTYFNCTKNYVTRYIKKRIDSTEISYYNYIKLPFLYYNLPSQNALYLLTFLIS